MRVTCPKCSTEYEIDISVLPETGRVVKCWKCAHDWLQTRPPSNFESRAAQEPAPSPAPKPAVNSEPAPNRSLDPNSARILQEEAARERLARVGKIKQEAKAASAAKKPAAAKPPAKDKAGNENSNSGNTGNKKTGAAKKAATAVSELVWPFQKGKKPETVVSDDAIVTQTDTRPDQKITLSQSKKPTVVEHIPDPDPIEDDPINFDDDFLLEWDPEEDAPILPPDTARPTPQRPNSRPAAAQPNPPSNQPRVHKVPVRVEVDEPEEKPQKANRKRRTGRAFRGGFMVAVLAFVLAALAYLFAPEITIRFPQTQPELGYYVTKVDEMRDRLSTIIIPAEGNQDADKN